MSEHERAIKIQKSLTGSHAYIFSMHDCLWY